MKESHWDTPLHVWSKSIGQSVSFGQEHWKVRGMFWWGCNEKLIVEWYDLFGGVLFLPHLLQIGIQQSLELKCGLLGFKKKQIVK